MLHYFVFDLAGKGPALSVFLQNNIKLHNKLLTSMLGMQLENFLTEATTLVIHFLIVEVLKPISICVFYLQSYLGTISFPCSTS
jgi:hypothetical protein